MRFVDDLLCPNTTSLVMEGNFGTKEFKYVRIAVEGCNLSEEECYTDEELIDKLDNLTLQMLTLMSYIDFSEPKIDDIVKYNTDFNTYLSLNSRI